MLSEPEVRSRYEVKLEKYNKLVNIEARTMKRMVRRAYLPAINAYAAEVAGHITAVKAASAGADTGQQERHCWRSCWPACKRDRRAAEQVLDDAHHANIEMADQQRRANDNAHHILPIMDKLRVAVDAVEVVVDRDHWPVPTYNDMLFYV